MAALLAPRAADARGKARIHISSPPTLSRENSR